MAKVSRRALIEEAGEGEPEVTEIWQEKNGIYGRRRYDWLTDRMIVDLKTSKYAEPSYWIRRVLFIAGYDISAAWYRGFAGDREYKWLVQETSPPYDYCWIGADAAMLETARKIVRKAIKLWGDCLKSGRWPGYSKHTHYPEPPAWREIQFEEAELAEQIARETFGG